MAPIEWRDSMSVDHGLIDEDHRHLIDIINRFEVVREEGRATRDVHEILSTLTFYTKVHFAREERLQRLAGYFGIVEHRCEHGKLLETLNRIIAMATSPEGPEIASTRLVQLLRDWLLNHVLVWDRGMTPFVDGLRRHSADVVALKNVVPRSRVEMPPASRSS